MPSLTVTAETEPGRRAIQEVMRRSYTADLGDVPARWARARVVDGVPASFILVDPDRRMEFLGGDLRYAFICDVATREDRRGEGHFRAIVEDTFASLRAEGIPLVLTHGRWQLYRRFGFDVFTHHSGIIATPDQIEWRLGTEAPEGAERLLTVSESPHLHADLLLITDVRAESLAECRAALLLAARLARSRGKARILLEHPAAPSYGSRYPIHPTLETPLAALARACGAEVRVQGADPEGRPVPDADWIKVLDAEALVRETLRRLGEPERPLPRGAIRIATDAGDVTVESGGDGAVVVGEREADPPAGPSGTAKDVGETGPLRWPSCALAQMVTGYQPADVLAAIHGTPLSDEAAAVLTALFPRRWRLSRNEAWTYRA